MEIYKNIISKEQIDNTICPTTSEDSLLNATINEVLLFDIKPKFDSELYDDLVSSAVYTESSGNTEDNSYQFAERTQQMLDAGLRLAIGYMAVSRLFRKPSTLTRYGVTDKLNDTLTSQPTSNSSAVAQSNYYKKCGEEIIRELLKDYSPAARNDNQGFGVKIIGY